MASLTLKHQYSALALVTFLLSLCSCSAYGTARPRKLFLVQNQPLVLKFHNGLLLKGNYTLNLVWYGSFTPSQRAIVHDFVNSLNHHHSQSSHVQRPEAPSVESWWRTTEKYEGGTTRLTLGRPNNASLGSYRIGKSLTHDDILTLAKSSGGPHNHAISVVLTSADVTVDGFCTSACGSHYSAPAGKHGRSRFAYLWVGNPATQCPGQCAWPFHKPIYGPQSKPLVAPNGDVGIDGMVINLATLLAGTVTNPFDDGYFQGPKDAPLEAVSACTGMFGKGAYPGYPGELLADKNTGGSYNAVGLYGRKYLLPAMWDPETGRCSTPI